MKKRFSEEQIIGILREGETDGVVIRDVCRKHSLAAPGRMDSWKASTANYVMNASTVNGSLPGTKPKY